MKTFRLITVALMAAMLCSLGACTNDELEREPQDDDSDEQIYTPQTQDDVVKTRVAGKTLFFMGGHSHLDSFLAKRFDNITTSYDDDVQLVLLNESKAAEVMADEELYGKIRSYWLQNKTIGFVKPAEKAIALIHSLKSAGSQLNASPSISEHHKQYMEDLLLFVTNANNKSLAYHSFDNKDRTHKNSNVIIDSETGDSDSNENSVNIPIKPNDYSWGQVAETLCAWFNKQQANKSTLLANMTHTRSESDLEPTKQEITHGELIALPLDYLNQFDDHYPRDLEPVQTTAILTIEILGGFNDNSGELCDVYDVVVTSEIPAQETFAFVDCTFKKSALYRYKATGFGYLGPTATYKLVHEDGSNITLPTSVHEMSPIVEGGTIKTTHTPGKLTFGGEISTKGGGAVSFSMKYTLPSTSTTISTADNPFDCSKEGSTGASWTYRKGAYDYYKHTWGFNGKYLETAPEITKTFASYKQAVTFKVENSRELGAKNLSLYVDVDYSFYSEACSPWKVNKHTDYIDIDPTYLVIDPVSRYFDKYTPGRFYSDANADSSSWLNLESLLMGSVNYKHFCNDDLRICAQLEEDLTPNAEAIWEETIETLITQYNGTLTGHEYIIGLASSTGEWIRFGLHIKDGEWSFVEDISALRDQISASK